MDCLLRSRRVWLARLFESLTVFATWEVVYRRTDVDENIFFGWLSITSDNVTLEPTPLSELVQNCSKKTTNSPEPEGGGVTS